MFQKFCAIQSYPLPKLVKFYPILCNFILGPCIAKKITQVLSYVVGTQVRRHVHKQFTKRRYGEEKPGRFVFGKPVLFTVDLGLTSLTPWVFLSEIFPDIRHCVYLVLDEIWAPDSCHKIGNNFFIHHCQSWKEGSFVCETVWFFRWWVHICLTWNLLRLFPNSVQILTWNFKKKLFRENFS